MKIINTLDEMRNVSRAYLAQGKTIGFVPTMGCLHTGHQSLIERSSAENDITVVSIFVNPTQFAPNEDLDKYPKALERDTQLAEQSGAVIIFHPSPGEIYPVNYNTYINVENLTTHLCGKSRPTHFRGVATIVAKMFNIITPNRAYFGQKDLQQLAVIKAMALDLNIPVEIISCPIVRERDGLALSSRNTYLTPEERAQSTVLYKALSQARALILAGETDCGKIKREITNIIATAALAQLEYAEIVDFDTITPIDNIPPSILSVPSRQKNTQMCVAIAVRFPSARLIDNIII